MWLGDVGIGMNPIPSSVYRVRNEWNEFSVNPGPYAYPNTGLVDSNPKPVQPDSLFQTYTIPYSNKIPKVKLIALNIATKEKTLKKLQLRSALCSRLL